MSNKDGLLEGVLISAFAFMAGILWSKDSNNEKSGRTRACYPAAKYGPYPPFASDSDPEQWHPEERQHRSKERKYWFLTALFAFIAAGGAAVSAIYAIGVFHQTKRQATAAESQVAVASDTEQRQLRAYLIVKPANSIGPFEEGKTAHLDGFLENLGQTPAFEAAMFSGINVFRWPDNGNMDQTVPCEQIVAREDAPRWFVAKTNDFDKDRTTAFTGPEIQGIKGGMAAIYFGGRLCYRDIFRTQQWMIFVLLGSGMAPRSESPAIAELATGAVKTVKIAKRAAACRSRRIDRPHGLVKSRIIAVCFAPDSRPSSDIVGGPGRADAVERIPFVRDRNSKIAVGCPKLGSGGSPLGHS